MAAFFCEQCGKTSTLLNVSEAASLLGVTRQTIYNWIDNGLIHCWRTPGGWIAICRNPLLRPVNPTKRKKPAKEKSTRKHAA